MLTSTAQAGSDLPSSNRDDRYRDAVARFGAAIGRLARGYERDAEARRDLVQEIHLALWRSLAGFDGRCSLRTWVYRVAHNVATAHLIRSRRAGSAMFVDLETLDEVAGPHDVAADADTRRSLERLLGLVERLAPLDRQLILLYLEGVEAADVAEIVGLSPGNVATRIHRIRHLLRKRFEAGGHD